MAIRPFRFEIVATQPGGPARAGIMHTSHGAVPTPCFLPVATLGSVKSLSPVELEGMDASMLMSNAYHLYLRPGLGVLATFGGLHSFIGWKRALMTDSGGFQVFSLSSRAEVTDEGALFRSHIDGSEHFFTPEKVIDIQETLGADIILPLDECVSCEASNQRQRLAADRTLRWAERSLAAHQRADQALFGIVQGGMDPELRAESAGSIGALGFSGYAIGGLSVGEPKPTMHRMLEAAVPLLPDARPRHLLGVGSPEDLFEGVARGIDSFDCVLPTRVARNGAVFTRRGRLNLRNARYAGDPRPIEEGCSCQACRQFSRAYLRHLIVSKELLGLRLATAHNVRFFLRLIGEIRGSIVDGCFSEFREVFLKSYSAVDPDASRHETGARHRKWRRRE